MIVRHSRGCSHRGLPEAEPRRCRTPSASSIWRRRTVTSTTARRSASFFSTKYSRTGVPSWSWEGRPSLPFLLSRPSSLVMEYGTGGLQSDKISGCERREREEKDTGQQDHKTRRDKKDVVKADIGVAAGSRRKRRRTGPRVLRHCYFYEYLSSTLRRSFSTICKVPISTGTCPVADRVAIRCLKLLYAVLYAPTRSPS